MATLFYDQSKYTAVRASLTQKNDEFFHQYVLVSSVLVKHWTSFLSVPELQVMQFVLGRTLLFRKRAESISKGQMLNGIPGVCGPCGLSRNTIDKVVSGLAERDYLILHAFKAETREQNSRIYELNATKMLAEHDIKEVGNMSRRMPRSRSIPTPRDGVPLPHELGGLTISTDVDITSTTNVVDSAVRLPTPKAGRRRVAVNCNADLDPRHTAMAIAAQATAKRDARARGATQVKAKRWSTVELQALLDKAQRNVIEEGYKVPRVLVVAKHINVLHKRILAAQVEDVLDFFTWTLQNWLTVSGANRRSKARQQEDGQKVGSAMLNTPNFNDLAFRLPYILAFYNEREHQKNDQAFNKEKERKEIEAYDKEVKRGIEARREQARLLDLKREEERKREATRPARSIRRTRAASTNSDDIPEFKERTWQR